MDILILVASMAVLSFAADRFVTAASSVATIMGASVMFVGVVLAGIGTSLPDWIVSMLAAADGEDGLAVGNFVGSNTVNVGLALGLAAIVTPIVVSESVLRKEAALSIAAVLACAAAMIGGIGEAEGIALIAALPVVLFLLKPKQAPPPDESLIEGSLPKEFLIAAIALAAMVGSSRLLVDSASDIAISLGVSEAFVGLTLVAFGTSLPEIVVGVRSAMRGETDLLIGNILGSNIFNSLALAGSAALVVPESPLDTSALAGPIALMAAFAVISGVLLATGRKLVRWEGVALVSIYLVTLPFFV